MNVFSLAIHSTTIPLYCMHGTSTFLMRFFFSFRHDDLLPRSGHYLRSFNGFEFVSISKNHIFRFIFLIVLHGHNYTSTCLWWKTLSSKRKTPNIDSIKLYKMIAQKKKIEYNFTSVGCEKSVKEHRTLERRQCMCFGVVLCMVCCFFHCSSINQR